MVRGKSTAVELGRRRRTTVETISRRDFVAGAGGLLAGASLADLLAACGGSSSAAGGGAPSGTLEIFSWWTAGGEADGLRELFNLYNRKYPSVTIKNAAVAGGAGTNAKAVLTTRMQGGKPPDSFQVHA